MDLLAVALPAPELITRLVPMPPRQTAWGVGEENRYLWNGEFLGRVLGFALTPSQVEVLPPRFRGDLQGWRMLEVAAEAYDRHEAAKRGRVPLALGPILQEILTSQDDWILHCIRDADQRPVEYSAMFPEQAVARVNSLLAAGDVGSDLVAWRR